MACLFHTGIVSRSATPIDRLHDVNNDRMRPIYLDTIARQIAELNIIGAHRPSGEYVRKGVTTMEWQAWGQRLKEVLELAGSPVAISYTDDPPEQPGTRKCSVCGLLKNVAAGETFVLTAETSRCPGGSQYLGLAAQHPERAKALRDFLINGEKLFACPASILRAQAMTEAKPPFGAADYIVFSPLEKAVLPPDVTVFLANGWQSARLINLAYYLDGAPMRCDPTGSLCRAAVTYPLVTGRVNVTFGDVTARRMEKFPEDVVFVSLPYLALRNAADSIDRCTAGTAKTEIPEEFRRELEQAGGEF